MRFLSRPLKHPRFAIVSLNKPLVKAYKTIIKKNFIYDEKRPDIVVSLGGDGTFLVAERRYPGIPKLLIRDSNICNNCDWDSLSPLMDRLKKEEYRIEEHMKLEATVKKEKRLCVNDVVVRNRMPIHAIRFRLFLDGKQVGEEFVGDGVVVSTPFGSTAYYYSITKKKFDNGIGIAFNNLGTGMDNAMAGENSLIEIEISRGDATLSCDNDEKILILKTGDKVTVRKSDEVVRIVKIGKGILTAKRQD